MPTVQAVPTQDEQLLSWSLNVKTLLTAAPASYFMIAAQATTYATAHTLFATQLAIATTPATRTKGSIAAKDAAKASLLVLARGYSKMISANPQISDQLKIDIGATVRKTPVTRPIPTSKPKLSVDSVSGWTMQVSATEEGQVRKNRKPKDVAGVMLFSYVGPVVPTDVSKFKFEGSTTLTNFTVVIDPSVPPGTPVHFTAFWFNNRQQSGPACPTITAYVQFGGMSKAA